MPMTDIEIARQAQKKPIQEIGDKLGIPSEHLLPFGHDKAKISEDFIKSLKDRPDGKTDCRRCQEYTQVELSGPFNAAETHHTKH